MWYYTKNETNHGPFQAEQMAQLIANGTVTTQTLVWCEGMTDWQPAGQSAFAAHFAPAKAAPIPVATIVPDPVAKQRLRRQNLWALAAMGWMFGALLIAVGMQKGGRLEATSGKPNRMTLAEFVKKGPGSNSYVELTNLRFGEKFWLEQDRNTDSWTKAWSFLFTESDSVNPVAITQIDGGGEQAMSKWMSSTTLRGLAEENPRFLRGSTINDLYKLYPKVKSRDLKWFIEVVNQRPSELGVKLAYGSGILLLVSGTICAFMVRITPKPKGA